MTTMNDAWLQTLGLTLMAGTKVSPRGQGTLEMAQQTTVVNMLQPVLTIPERKLHYSFMAAEAHWILTGDNKVESIARYNNRIADFSDDGVSFFGAYGPKIIAQLPYVINKLESDPDSRQAGLTIWRESPPNTKDVPCTVAVWFQIRSNGGPKLNTHVFMRSSDIWLGLPYDVFNFSMLTCLVASQLNRGTLQVAPGDLYLTAASSHLYERNKDEGQAIFDHYTNQTTSIKPLSAQVPRDYYLGSPDGVIDLLARLRDTKPGSPHRWWETV